MKRCPETSRIRPFYTGTSGLVLPVPNKQFYPEEYKDKSRLCYYGSLMNSIEINSSFYKIPMASTVRKWADDTPENFKFTYKLFQGITHNQELAFDPDVVNRFMNVISHAGTKKGCLLVQFPPSIKIDRIRQMEQLLRQLRDNDPDLEWKINLEFRHPSLYHEEVYGMLEAYQMGMVVHDRLPAITPMEEISSAFVYLRFHGPDGGNYRGSYADEILYEYASYVEEWLREDKEVYVYFNNTMGDAIKNLFTLRAYVNGEHVF